MTIVERDPETGRIVKGGKQLSSEDAKALAARKHAKSVSQKQNDVEILLNEAGFDDPTSAPKALQILCGEIAEGGSRLVSALVEYRRQVSPQDTSGMLGPQPGERCSMCGVYNVSYEGISDADMAAIEQAQVEYINWFRKKYGDAKPLLDPDRPYQRHYGVRQPLDDGSNGK